MGSERRGGKGACLARTLWPMSNWEGGKMGRGQPFYSCDVILKGGKMRIKKSTSKRAQDDGDPPAASSFAGGVRAKFEQILSFVGRPATPVEIS